jgi:hypothetical protein
MINKEILEALAMIEKANRPLYVELHSHFGNIFESRGWVITNFEVRISRMTYSRADQTSGINHYPSTRSVRNLFNSTLASELNLVDLRDDFARAIAHTMKVGWFCVGAGSRGFCSPKDSSWLACWT